MRTVSGGLYGFEGGLLAICRAFFSVMSPGAGQGLVVFLTGQGHVLWTYMSSCRSWT